MPVYSRLRWPDGELGVPKKTAPIVDMGFCTLDDLQTAGTLVMEHAIYHHVDYIIRCNVGSFPIDVVPAVYAGDHVLMVVTNDGSWVVATPLGLTKWFQDMLRAIDVDRLFEEGWTDDDSMWSRT